MAFPGSEDARALAVVAPLTSQIRAMRGEVDLGKPRWLPKRSAVNVQGLASLDHRSSNWSAEFIPPGVLEALLHVARSSSYVV